MIQNLLILLTFFIFSLKANAYEVRIENESYYISFAIPDGAIDKKVAKFYIEKAGGGWGSLSSLSYCGEGPCPSDIEDPIFIKNMKINIENNQKIREAMKEYEKFKGKIPELDELLLSQINSTEFEIWYIEELRYKFFTTWDVNVFRQNYKNIPYSKEGVEEVIKKIQKIKTKQEKYMLINYREDLRDFYRDKSLTEYDYEAGLEVFRNFCKKYNVIMKECSYDEPKKCIILN